jgi:hypothetical protein
MDPLIALTILGSVVVAIMQHYASWSRAKTEQIEQAQVQEEPIEDILDRYRRSRRQRRVDQKTAWDEWYFLSLPIEEHPEYFELNLATDNVDSFTQKSADGMICAQFEFRSNSRGQAYNLEIDHVTQMAKVSTGKISWEVPLHRVDNWRQLT